MVVYKIRHIKTGKYINDVFNSRPAYFSNINGRLFDKKSEVVHYFVMSIKKRKIKQDDYTIESFGLVSQGDLDNTKEVYLGIEKSKRYDLRYESSRLVKVMKATLKEVL